MDEDLKKLVEKNIELTERIARDVKKMRHHFWMANTWSIVKIFVFIVFPLYLGYRYINPYMGQLQAAYQQVLQIQQGVSGFTQNLGEVQKNLGGLKDAAGKLQGATKQLGELQKQLPSGGSGGGIPSMPSIPGLEFLFGGKK